MDPEDKLQELILAGAVEVAGIDPMTGEFLYAFTENIKEIDPEMARQSEEFFNRTLYLLWEQGFLAMDVTQTNPVVSLMPKALDEEEVSRLDLDTRIILNSVIQALRI
jgi:hypothetical protein